MFLLRCFLNTHLAPSNFFLYFFTYLVIYSEFHGFTFSLYFLPCSSVVPSLKYCRCQILPYGAISCLILSQNHMSESQRCARVYELDDLDAQAREGAGAQ